MNSGSLNKSTTKRNCSKTSCGKPAIVCSSITVQQAIYFLYSEISIFFIAAM